MPTIRRAAVVVAAVLSQGLVQPAHAQQQPATPAAQQTVSPEPQPPPASASSSAAEAIALPPVVVEAAPAKRNVKKATIKVTGSERRGAVAAAQPSPPAAPGPSATAPATAAATTVVTEDPVPAGIVIEGEKTLKTLRNTTTSVGVVTGAQIRNEQIEDLQGALNSQANVLATEGSDGNNGFTVRGLNSEGLTQNQNPSAAPLVSVVIDGATQNPEATRRGARALWDVEQVEVLRGPQSALQGRSSLAGTVFVKTKDPTYKWETIIEGTAANQDLKSGGFVFNAPIVANQMALRISGQAMHREHEISYADPANNPLDEDYLRSMRGKLLIEPDSMPGLSALFTIARVTDKPGVLSVSAPFFDRELVLGFGGSVDFRETLTTNYISDVGYAIVRGVTIRSITSYADTETTIGSAATALI